MFGHDDNLSTLDVSLLRNLPRIDDMLSRYDTCMVTKYHVTSSATKSPGVYPEDDLVVSVLKTLRSSCSST